MQVSAVLLVLACAGAQAADAQLGRVEVQGEAATAREKKTLGQLFKAEALFEKHHALAPAAALKFKGYARTQTETTQGLELGLMTPAGRQRVVLD
ncbi:MAG: hypothetical protein EOP93_21265, partial [Lysobacteraceae bacterium]